MGTRMTLQGLIDWAEENGLDLETEIVISEFSGTGDLCKEQLQYDEKHKVIEIDTTV